MILVMVVLGGMGSVWGVVLGALFLQLLQSWFLPDLTGWIDQFGVAVGSDYIAHVDLVQSIELIFGIILVLMMLYRRDGLIPAHRKATALTFDQQHAVVTRVTATTLPGIAPPAERGRPALEIKGVTVRFGGLVALNAVDLVVPSGGVVRGHRPQRLRQVHPVQHRHRADPRRQRQHPLSRHGTPPGWPRTASSNPVSRAPSRTSACSPTCR